MKNMPSSFMEKLKEKTRRDHTVAVDLFFIAVGAVSVFVFACILFAKLFRETYTERDALNLLESFLCLILLVILPFCLKKIFKLRLTLDLEICALLLIYSAFVLGDCCDFYYYVPWGDSILHIVSGIALAEFAYVLADSIHQKQIDAGFSLSPFFKAVFAISFAVFMASVWELLEFVFDGILQTNAQQFMQTTYGTYYTENDIPKVGHAALADTMKDIFLDLVGGIIMVVHHVSRDRKNKDDIANQLAEQEERAQILCTEELREVGLDEGDLQTEEEEENILQTKK